MIEGVGTGRAGGVFIAKEFHIATQWYPANAPFCAVLIVPFSNGAAKTNRKYLDPHTAPARDIEMPELMEKYHNGQHKDEGNQICQPKATVQIVNDVHENSQEFQHYGHF
jgi:hypothetical protein